MCRFSASLPLLSREISSKLFRGMPSDGRLSVGVVSNKFSLMDGPGT